MSLQEMLNRSRADVSLAFLSMQKTMSHTIDDYILRVVSD